MLAHLLLCLASQSLIGMHSGEGVSCPACMLPPWAGNISPEFHYHPLCCWPPTNTSLPISISCLPDTSLQRGYQLHLIPPGSMCSNLTLFPPEKLLERSRMLPTVSLTGAGRANFLPPSIKHRTTSQGLVCTLISGTVISGDSCFSWCQSSFNGKNNLRHQIYKMAPIRMGNLDSRAHCAYLLHVTMSTGLSILMSSEPVGYLSVLFAYLYW